MIIFCQPMYSKQELNADSNYVIYSQFIRAMLVTRPTWHFVVVFPDANSGFKYDDGFFRLPNVTRVSQRISPRKMANATSFDARWYDVLMRRIGFDLVWCNLVEIAAQLRSAGAGTFEAKGRPITVAAHNYVIHETLPYPFHAQAHVAFAQLSGALFADHNVFNSDYCQWMLLDNARKFLAPEQIAEIEGKSTRIDYGPLEPSLKRRTPRNTIPVIAYNHRLQGHKNYKDTFALFDDLHRSGVKFSVRYMNNSSENLATIAHYPFLDVRMCATRKDYLEALADCDVNVTNSQHETFCISAIESMAFGQPVIAPDGITFPEITGRSETGYPYLFKTPEDQRAMLIRLLTDTTERRRWGKVLSDYVLAHYTSDLWTRRYAELFERLTDFTLGTPDDVRAFVKKQIKISSGQPIKVLMNRVYGETVNGRIPFSDQSLPLTKLVRLVRELGGRVTIEHGEQLIYVR